MGDRLRHYIYVGIGIGVTIAVLKYVLPALAPFIFAAIIAFIIDPAVNLLERRGGLPRGVASALALLALLALLLGLFFLVVSRLVQEIVDLSKLVPSYYSTLAVAIEDVFERFGTLPAPIRGALQVQGERLLLLLQNLLEWVLGALRQVPSALLGIVVTFVAAFFMSRDKDMVTRFLISLMPTSIRGRMLRARRQLLASTLGLAKATLLLMGISTALTTLGLVVARVEFAIVMGLVIGLADLLPIVGPSTVFWPWIGYNLFFGNPWLALKLAIVFAGVSLTRTILEPRIIGARIGVHPLATLLSLYLGVRLLGVWGFIIGPLVAILLKCAVASGLIQLPEGAGGNNSP